MSGSDSGVISGKAYLTLSASDVIQIGIAETAGTTDPTIYSSNWTVKRL